MVRISIRVNCVFHSKAFVAVWDHSIFLKFNYELILVIFLGIVILVVRLRIIVVLARFLTELRRLDNLCTVDPRS